MAHEAEFPYIFRENMKIYLDALNKRMYYHNYHGEIMIAGGSALILGHDFRDCTEDIDTYMRGTDILVCVAEVKELFSLTNDWMNNDFTRSP